MAVQKNNILINGFSGKLGKQIVLKMYGNRQVLSKYPDRSKVVYSKNQKKEQSKFALAVAYAQSINNNPAKKKAYAKKLKKGQTVYHAAIREYLLDNAG